MKLIPLALLSGTCLLPLTDTATELVCSPEAGSRLTTTHERVLVLTLGDTELSLSLDGEEQEGAEAPDIELTLRETESIAFTDTYEKLDGGRVTLLRRKFDKIGTLSAETLTDIDGQNYESETPGASALESASVEFRWDAAAEEYAARFADDEDLDTDLLEGLEAVADLSWFLPGDAVEEGDEWEIDVEAFPRMSSPSGDLKIIREGEEDDEEDDFGEQFDEHLDGRLTGEFQGFRTESGRRLAVIHVTGELETYVEQEQAVEGEIGGDGTSAETFRFTFELAGDLLWDVEAGHAESFLFSGEVEMILESHEEYSGEGHELEFSSTQEFSGTVKFDIRVE